MPKLSGDEVRTEITDKDAGPGEPGYIPALHEDDVDPELPNDVVTTENRPNDPITRTNDEDEVNDEDDSTEVVDSEVQDEDVEEGSEEGSREDEEVVTSVDEPRSTFLS